jgi:glycine/D-amino acid oxidase-like deaminating enzyme
MDLTTGNLLWPAVSSAAIYGSPTPDLAVPLDRDLRCQALVVGAGISGAMAACMLAEAGVQTVVVDRRGVAEGSTPASTALVLYELDTPLIDLAAIHGVRHAQRAYRASRRSLDDLADLVRRMDIDCDLNWRGSLYLARYEREAEWFIREAAARQAIGIEVEPLSRRELMDRFELGRPAALHSAAAIELDPLALTQGLIASAQRLGATVYAPTNVSVEHFADARMNGHGEHVLRTDAGCEIRCRHLVIATGYEAPEQFEMIARRCTLKSTYALASEPLYSRPPWPGRVLIWETGDGYFYARQTSDNRVIMGGEDELIEDPDQRDALIDHKAERLCQKFAQLCPDVDLRPEFTWAGTFAETEDGLPLIGQTQRWPRCHFTLAFGGNGVTFSVLAGQIIRDAIVGWSNGDEDLFRIDR